MAGGCRMRSGPRWSPCCRRGRGTLWAATTRGCRTAGRWTRSSSCCAPAASGTRSTPPGSAPRPRRIAASWSGRGPACSRCSGAGASWPMTMWPGSTGAGWRWTGPWARPRWVGKKTGRNPTDRGKLGSKRSLLTDGRGVPLGLAIAGANRNDHKLMRETLETIAVERPTATPEAPQGLCLDKGYDYDEVRDLAVEFGFTLHLRTRGEEIAAKREAGSKARRWVVERTHSWLNRFRRILVRWEKRADTYLAMLHFALALITWRHAGLTG